MNFLPFIVVLIVIVIDIISGLASATKNREITSTKMREGLFSKCGSIIIEIVAFLSSLLVLWFPEFPIDFSGVYIGVSVYIVVMELISIIENACELNPKLSASRIAEFFKVTHKGD